MVCLLATECLDISLSRRHDSNTEWLHRKTALQTGVYLLFLSNVRQWERARANRRIGKQENRRIGVRGQTLCPSRSLFLLLSLSHALSIACFSLSLSFSLSPLSLSSPHLGCSSILLLVCLYFIVIVRCCPRPIFSASCVPRGNCFWLLICVSLCSIVWWIDPVDLCLFKKRRGIAVEWFSQ